MTTLWTFEGPDELSEMDLLRMQGMGLHYVSHKRSIFSGVVVDGRLGADQLIKKIRNREQIWLRRVEYVLQPEEGTQYTFVCHCLRNGECTIVKAETGALEREITSLGGIRAKDRLSTFFTRVHRRITDMPVVVETGKTYAEAVEIIGGWDWRATPLPTKK